MFYLNASSPFIEKDAFVKTHQFWFSYLSLGCFYRTALINDTARTECLISVMAATLDNEEYWSQTFDTFDVNQSGSIDSEELRKLMQVCQLNPSQSQVDEVMEVFDING